jgi:hypothetical protein
MTDDLVAAPGKINRVELQRSKSLNKCKHRSTSRWKRSRREEHVALG